MYLEVHSDNPFDTNCWLIAAEGSDEALVVDPGFQPNQVRAMLDRAGKTPIAVLATHGHYDHIGSAGAFCGDDIPFYIHEADVLALSEYAAWGGLTSERSISPVPVKDVRTVADCDVLTFAGFRIEVLHTPGHTPGSVVYRTDGWALSGDLVFAGTIGRSDFPNSSPHEMQGSLRRFLELPDPTAVYPGHGPRTTVGRERASNPFLRDL
jgi:glyoxylase-like metal-dependent hydrolase (beta-lactamase superfamily II)